MLADVARIILESEVSLFNNLNISNLSPVLHIHGLNFPSLAAASE